MLVFNFDKIQKEEINNTNIINIPLHIKNIEMNYFDLYKIIFYDIFTAIKDSFTDDNLVFNINLTSTEDLDEDDVEAVFNTCTNIICNKFICYNIARNREQRLTTDMSGINYGQIGWLKLINNDTIINKFNIQLWYKGKAISLIEF